MTWKNLDRVKSLVQRPLTVGLYDATPSSGTGYITRKDFTGLGVQRLLHFCKLLHSQPVFFTSRLCPLRWLQWLAFPLLFAVSELCVGLVSPRLCFWSLPCASLLPFWSSQLSPLGPPQPIAYSDLLNESFPRLLIVGGNVRCVGLGGLSAFAF